MRLTPSLALVLSLLVAETEALNETVASSSLTWKACKSSSDYEIELPSSSSDKSAPVSKLIECATLTVPLCYDDTAITCAKGCNMTHTLQLSRLATATAANAATLWIAQDALLTSQSADELMTRITQHATSNVNVYALESRLFANVFTANYTEKKPSPCASMVNDYATRPLIEASFVTALVACRTWLDTTLGTGGVNVYSLDSAARDLSLAMSTVQAQEKTPNNTATYVYASGRATRVVQRLLSQTKAAATATAVSVAGVILDSPFPTPTAEKPVDEAMSRFVSACATDSVCKSKFTGPSLVDVITQVYALVDGNTTIASSPSQFANASECVSNLKTAVLKDARDLTASHGVRRLLAKLRRSTSDSGPKAVPAVMYRVRRCNDDDKSKLDSFFTHVSYTFDSSVTTTGMKGFVETVVMASELWPAEPEPTREQLTADFRASLVSDGVMLQQQPSYCAYIGSTSTACQALYKPGVASSLDNSLTYTPSAKATDTSVFASVDVLIMASRLSPTGSATAASQLYDALGSTTKQANGTLLMVQSDRLDETQLTSATSDVELRLVGEFLNAKPRGRSGAWLSSDLTALDWSLYTATSTLATSPSAVDFNMSSTDSFTWFSGSDAYEIYKNSGDDWYTSHYNFDYSTGSFFVTPIVIVAIVTTIVLACWCRGRRRRSKTPPPPPQPVEPTRPTAWSPQPEPRQPPESPPPPPLAVLVFPPSAPDFPQDEDSPQLFPPASPAEPCGLQPLQWEADHANEYALSYTPRDSDTMATRL